MSADGSRVAFTTVFVGQGGSEPQQLYVGETATGAVRWVSETAGGVAANGHASWPAISGDARWVGVGHGRDQPREQIRTGSSTSSCATW